MTKVIASAAVRAELHNLDGLLEFCDETGRTLGFFHPLVGSEGGKLQSPIPKDEVERRRKQRTGRPLTDILEGLHNS